MSRNADSAPLSAPRTSSTSVAGTLSVSLRENRESCCRSLQPIPPSHRQTGVQLMTRPFRITDVPAKTLIFVAVAPIHVTVPSRLLAQAAGGAELHPVRITTPPKLDGILDDEAWSGDPLSLEGWASYNPMRGEAPAEKTEVWMGYDTEALYLAFRCLD